MFYYAIGSFMELPVQWLNKVYSMKFSDGNKLNAAKLPTS